MKTKMKFKNLSIPMIIERARRIAKMMMGNAYFPAPVPSLAAFNAAIMALETAYNEAADGGKSKKAVMRLRKAELMKLVRKLAAYVEVASDGDEEIILSSGFDIIKPRAYSTISQVLHLRTSGGIFPGSIHAIWDPVPGSGAYFLEISSTGPNGSYVLHRIVLKTRFTLTGLTPAALYWIRVTAVGRDGYGLPSDPSAQTASLNY